MAYYNMDSSALDLGRFDVENSEPAPQLQAMPRSSTRRESQPAHKVPLLRYAVLCAMVFAALGAIVFGYMRLSELTAQNDRIKTQISDLQGDLKGLEAKREQIYTLSFVEDYAQNRLGMVKQDQGEVTYIDMSNPESITISSVEETPSELVSGLLRGLNAVVEYIK